MSFYTRRSMLVFSTLIASIAMTSCGEQTSGLTLVAGQERAHVDGLRTAAKLAFPTGIVSNQNDFMFVIDKASHTVRRITPGGTITTLAGSPYQRGSTDGAGGAATFDTPVAIAIDRTRNRLYVADLASNTIRMVTTSGVVTTFAGQAGQAGHVDGQGSNARFMFSKNENQVVRMVIDQAGNLYITDALGLRKITPQGSVSTHFADMAVFESINGTTQTDEAGNSFPVQASIAHDLGFNASGSTPYTGLVIDSNNNFITSQQQNNQLLKISPSGSALSTLTIPVSTAGATLQGIDTNNNVIIISPQSQNLIRANLDQQTIQHTQVLPPTFSDEYSNSLALSIKTREASQGVIVDNNGNLLSVDPFGAVIRKYTPTTIGEYASNNGIPVDGADPEELNTPVLVQTILTGRTTVYGFDNGSVAPNFIGTNGVASDNDGNLYITDAYHAIRRFSPSNNLVITRSGKTFSEGTTDGTNQDALFRSPSGIVYNPQNNRLYILDNYGTSIRQMTVIGQTTTLNLSQPIQAQHIVKSPNNNMFIKGNALIQQVLPNGVVSTIADLSSYSGYTVKTDQGLAIDSQQNLYTMSSGRVLKVTPQGVISTMAGSLNEYDSTNGQLLDARFRSDARVVGVNPVTGNVYVSECLEELFSVSCKVRKIEQSSGLVSDSGIKTSIHIGPIHFAANGDAYTTYENAVYRINNIN